MKSLPRFCAALAAATLAAPAFAGYTAIKAAPAEASTTDILGHVYGGTFVTSGNDFANGHVTATRLEDQTDQIWTGQKFVATAVARFSGYTQGFGYFDAAGGYQPLFETAGEGFDVAGSATFIPRADSFSWGRSGDSGTQSSEELANADGRDHLITYEITGLGSTPMWLLFWEDLDRVPGMAKGRSTSDFNDLVVSLKSVPNDPTGPVAVPLPPAAVPGIITAGLGLAFAARRKFAKR